MCIDGKFMSFSAKAVVGRGTEAANGPKPRYRTCLAHFDDVVTHLPLADNKHIKSLP